jgi:hypothetical protein
LDCDESLSGVLESLTASESSENALLIESHGGSVLWCLLALLYHFYVIMIIKYTL